MRESCAASLPCSTGAGGFPGVVLSDAAREFAAYTRREMDFRLEAQTATRLRHQATRHEKVPAIYYDLSTQHVLTMEFIDGINVGRAAALLQEEGLEGLRAHRRNSDPNIALHRFAFASLNQLFGTGFFSRAIRIPAISCCSTTTRSPSSTSASSGSSASTSARCSPGTSRTSRPETSTRRIAITRSWRPPPR